MPGSLSERSDFVDNAVKQYFRQSSPKTRVVASEIIGHKSSHRAGGAKNTYRFRVEKDGLERSLYAKHDERPDVLTKEYSVLNCLAGSKAAGPVTVPMPLMFKDSVLLTDGAQGSMLLQFLPGLSRCPAKRFQQQAADAKYLFARQLELDWAYFSIASPLPNTEM